MGGYQEKHTKQGKVAMQIKVIVFSIEKSFQRLSHPALPGTERDTSFQMEIFLNRWKSVFPKGNFYSVLIFPAVS